jgi:integrase
LGGQNRLKAVELPRKRERGLYPDGGGLYLQVTRTETRSWLFKFTLNGRAREMGLGPFPLVSLADARLKRDDARRLLLDGIDPIEVRKADRDRKKIDAAKSITFKGAAAAFLVAKRAGWQNVKHAAQWDATLATYVYPVFGSLPVGAVDVGLVMKVLEPIWTTKSETASRVRGRIEAILNWAKTRGYRDGENPARWRGHLENLLAAKGKVRKVEHHAALPYAEVGAFMSALRERGGVSARALEFLILTATRTSETLNADWHEIDLRERLWIIPASRMKASREHRIPLSDAAVALLERMQPLRLDNIVFPGMKGGRPLSNMALLVLLRRMGRGDLTAHGFRSTFRDWCAERTSFPGEVAEMALAHAVGDKVEAAYRRGDLFEKRRRLMADWADFCAAAPLSQANVVPLRPNEAAQR